ncbi:MAG: transporter substrate-binding domain-containing protein [Myxococcales bacterium]|jgi:polar amino acid transport system substrate-binding protein
MSRPRPTFARSFRPCLLAGAVAFCVCPSSIAAQAPDAGAPDAGGAAAHGSPASPEPPAARPGTQLRVAYAGSAPFVVEGTPADGLSLAVWRVVADAAGLSYRLVPRSSVRDALDGVARGELDVAVGPISITSERARRVRFTQPYFQSRIGILAPERAPGLWSQIAPFLTRVFAGASLVLALLLLGIGTAMWLVERRKNPDHFPVDPARGIANGVWFALVTMTTVGYGDRVPVTPGGRVVAGLWMLVALVTTTSLTAGFASAFTVLQLDTTAIRDARDLRGRPVAAVSGTTGASFVRDHGAQLVAADDLGAAVQAARDGEAAAVVHDRPILQHYLVQHPEVDLKLAPASYDPQGYGFAVAPGSPLLNELDVALLLAKEDGRIQRITSAWLGRTEQ